MIFAGERAVDHLGTVDDTGLMASDSTRDHVLKRLLEDRKRAGTDDMGLALIEAEFKESWSRSLERAALRVEDWRLLVKDLRSAASFLAVCYRIAVQTSASPLSARDLVDEALEDLPGEDHQVVARVLASGLLSLAARYRRFFDSRGVLPGEGVAILTEGIVIRAEITINDPTKQIDGSVSIGLLTRMIASLERWSTYKPVCIPDSTGLTVIVSCLLSDRKSAEIALQTAEQWMTLRDPRAVETSVACGLSWGRVEYGPMALDAPGTAITINVDDDDATGLREVMAAVGDPVLAAKRAAMLAALRQRGPRLAVDERFRHLLDESLRDRFGRCRPAPGPRGGRENP